MKKCVGTGLYYYGARYYDPKVSIWLSTDPLQEKYPNVSTYAYCILNPVRFIDPDGREPGDIIILFTGADFGQGPTETTTKIFNDIMKNYNSETIIIYSSLYFLSCEQGISGAFDEIIANNKINPENKIIIYGYSYGGKLANYLAKKLKEKDVMVDLLITVDAANGWGSDNIDRTISGNVVENDNYYQTNTSFWSDPTLSHGGQNSGGKTRINNHNMSEEKYNGEKIDHMNIDDATYPTVVNKMGDVMQRKEKNETN